MQRRIDVRLRDDGSAEYVTCQGDVTDEIAWRFYGTEFGTTEALLDANPALPENAIELPPGLTIVLPARRSAPKPVPRRELWD